MYLGCYGAGVKTRLLADMYVVVEEIFNSDIIYKSLRSWKIWGVDCVKIVLAMVIFEMKSIMSNYHLLSIIYVFKNTTLIFLVTFFLLQL